MDEPLDNLDEKDPYDLSAYKKKRKPSKNRGESKEGSDYAELRPDPKGLSIDSESDYQKFVRKTLSELTNISTDRSKLPFTNEEDIYKILPKGLDVSQFSHLPFKDEPKSPTPQTSNIEFSPKLEITDPLSLAGKQLTGPYSEEDQQVIQSRSKVRKTDDIPTASEFADLQIPRYSLPTTPLQKFQESEQSKLTTPPTLLSFPELPILPTLPPTSETAFRKMSTRQERKIGRQEFAEKLNQPGITVGQPPKFTPTATPYLGVPPEPIPARTAFTRNTLDQAVKSVVGSQDSPVLTRSLQQASQALSPEQIQAQRPLDSMRPGSFSRQEEVTKLRQSFDHDFQKFLSFFADQEMNVSRRPGEPATAYDKDQGQNIPPDVLARAMKQWNDLGEKLERLVDGLGPKELETSAIVGKPFMGPPIPPEEQEKFPFDPPSGDDNGDNSGTDNQFPLFYFLNETKTLLGKISDIIGEFQAVALSRGYEKPMSVLNNSFTNNIPAMTELRISTIMLRTGLERNSSKIAEYIARSDLLGENTFALATSIRSFSTTMGLTNSEQDAFVEAIADSALQYKNSTEELAASIAGFVQQIGLATIAGDKSTVDAYRKLEARIGRFLDPGTLQKAMAPFSRGGIGEVMPAAAFFNAGRERQVMSDMLGGATAEQKVNAFLQLIEKANKKGEQIATATRDINLFRTVTTGLTQGVGGPEFFVLARQIQDAVEKSQDPESNKKASIDDARESILKIADRIAEPIALLGHTFLIALDFLKLINGSLAKGIVSGIVISSMLASIRVLVNIAYALPTILRQQLSVLTTIATNTSRLAGTPMGGGNAAGKAGVMGGALALFGGWPGVVLLALAYLPSIFESVFGTKENTKQMKESLKKKDNELLPDAARESLISQAQLISTVSNETVRTSMLIKMTDRDDIKAQHAKLQLDRLKEIVDRLTEIKDKRSPLPDRMDKLIGK